MGLKLDRTIGRQTLPHEGLESRTNLGGVLPPDEAERHFGASLGRQHGLESGAAISARDAVDLRGRARPHVLQHGAATLTGWHRQADTVEELRLIERQGPPLLGHLDRELLDTVVEPRQRHPAVLGVEIGEDTRQDVDRVRGGAAEHSRMEVAVGGLDDHLLAHETAQHGGDRRRFGVPHAGVADEGEIGLERVPVGRHEGGQGRRARFLLALEQHRDLAGQAAGLAEGAAGLDEGHELTLVVGRAPGDDPLAVLQLGLERIGGPQIQRIDRLHVVVTVEQHVRCIAMGRLGVTEHHRAARGRMHGSLEAKLGQLLRQPRGGLVAVRRIGDVGRDGGDRQKLEQPAERSGPVRVEGLKDGIDRGHGRLAGGGAEAAGTARCRKVYQPLSPSNRRKNARSWSGPGLLGGSASVRRCG